MTEPPLDDHEPDDATRVGDADDTSTFDAFDIGEDTGMSVARPTGRLVCLVGREPGRVYPLGPRPVVIGRGADAQIQLEGHDVSRAHARVSWLVDHFVLEDLGSRNGVSVNGVPVRTHRLQLGDRIQIGGAAILVLAENDDLERRALRLQRLEALGELASGVVHDFKNTLSVILGNLELLEHHAAERYGGDDDLAAGLASIRAAADATGELTRRLLYFAHRETPGAATPVPLRALVDEVVSLLRHKLSRPSRVEVDVDVDPAVQVTGRRGELHHVLLNLCLNARDAMPGGGRLALHAERVELSRPAAMHLHLPAPGAYVELTVRDTGTGMDEVTLARVFEPFFTTKRPGEGTGLGLATVYGVVRSHGGNVLVDSTPGDGTTFRLLLPAAASDGGDRTG